MFHQLKTNLPVRYWEFIWQKYSTDSSRTRLKAVILWEKHLLVETPFNTLPVLETDGFQIGQTMSIARYLGDEFGEKRSGWKLRSLLSTSLHSGLRGDSNIEKALVDSVTETADDLLADYLNFTFNDDKSANVRKESQFTHFFQL